MKQRIFIIGMGPGKEEMMTQEAVYALEQADTIIGYKVYLDLLSERFHDKQMISTPMKQEIQRCKICFEEAKKGKKVALLCNGDAGIYGIAALMYALRKDYPQVELLVIPGVTVVCSGAAVLGAT